jgi:hypothetical protein
MVRRPADLERLRAAAMVDERRPKEACLVVADAQGRDEPLPVDDLAALASWRDPAAEAYLPAAVAAASAEWNEEQTVYWRWVAAVARGDDAELAALRTLLRDGRYALQSTFDGRRAAAVLGGEALAFWIDELGSNCCRKSDLADDAPSPSLQLLSQLTDCGVPLLKGITQALYLAISIEDVVPSGIRDVVRRSHSASR